MEDFYTNPNTQSLTGRRSTPATSGTTVLRTSQKATMLLKQGIRSESSDDRPDIVKWFQKHLRLFIISNWDCD